MPRYPRSLLMALHSMMVKIRQCEESLVEPILSGRIRCPVHLYTGQEAVAVGVCAALTRRDYVFGNHRSHGHFLAKGGDLNALVSEMYGKEPGCSSGRGGSMHLIDPSCGFLGSVPIVGGTIALAVGSALSSAIRRDRRVTTAFFGDGATNEGVFYESLNFAALHHLPMLFICENNLYSTHLPIRECRASTDIASSARALGVQSIRVDGNDVMAIYDRVRSAVTRCQQGKGPVFLECMTYRMRGHVGPDDNIQGTHTDIRSKKEIDQWSRKDPIQRLEGFLVRHRLADEDTLSKVHLMWDRRVRAAHERAAAAPYPEETGLLIHVTADERSRRE